MQLMLFCRLVSTIFAIISILIAGLFIFSANVHLETLNTGVAVR